MNSISHPISYNTHYSLSTIHLAFDPSGITKHGLTYITLFQVHSKEHLYLLFHCQTRNFK